MVHENVVLLLLPPHLLQILKDRDFVSVVCRSYCCCVFDHEQCHQALTCVPSTRFLSAASVSALQHRQRTYI